MRPSAATQLRGRTGSRLLGPSLKRANRTRGISWRHEPMHAERLVVAFAEFGVAGTRRELWWRIFGQAVYIIGHIVKRQIGP
jgi:hypothetical protein